MTDADEQYAILRDPEMKEIFDSFLVETKEILEQLDLDLVELERQPGNLELLNKIFRAFHTVKGTSGFLGLTRFSNLTHRAEDVLNKLRKGEMILNEKIMEGILRAYDDLKELMIVVETQLNEDYDIDGTVNYLQEILDSYVPPSTQPKPEDTVPVIEAEQQVQVSVLDEEDEEERKEAEVKKEESSAQVERKVKTESTNTEHSKVSDNTIRVDVGRLDDLLNLVSELVLGRNRLSQVYHEAQQQYEGTKLVRDLSEASRQIDLMTTELQLAVMKTRMIKIGKVFNKFPRLVRDLSKETKKEIELEIRGEETELDKTLIEEINDPLVHLVRNSIDHGIEPPQKRKEAGKPAIGKIILSAEHEGNNIIISIQDDGAGIDTEKIKSKAVNKGLITQEKANELSKTEAYNLLFLPGFSTAEKVTNISGRGVGLDVVKTNVTKLRGLINIESEPGKGTLFQIKLPLTLAIIQGLLVKIQEEMLVIPLASVYEVVKLNKNQIYTIKGKEAIRLRDEVLPLFDIGALLYKFAPNGHDTNFQHIVIVGVAEKKFGIKVDSLVGQNEVVIKSLGSYLGSVRGIAGSTIMGDGKVVMILDLAEIVHLLTE